MAATMMSKRGKGGGGLGVEETLVAQTLRSQERNTSQGSGNYVAAPLTKGSATGKGVNAGAAGVRRLTPTECERLQGLPDGWTQLGDTPDSRRYSALGDAVTANVAEWIGGRLVTELVR